MVKQVIIRKVIAAVMLVIFSFSVTPTILLHNWFADHIDSVKKVNGTDQEQLSAKKFFCQCDNIVAESPFTETGNILIPVPGQTFALKQGHRFIQVISTPRFYFSLRGPPVV